MANVKTRKDVKTQGELQNLVTSIILRTEGKFKVEELLAVINWHLAGSIYQRTEETKKCLDFTLDTLETAGKVIFEDGGVYEVKRIF